jgi:hypothetical protein
MLYNFLTSRNFHLFLTEAGKKKGKRVKLWEVDERQIVVNIDLPKAKGEYTNPCAEFCQVASMPCYHPLLD